MRPIRPFRLTPVVALLVAAVALAGAGSVLPWWSYASAWWGTPPDIGDSTLTLNGEAHFASGTFETDRSCALAAASPEGRVAVCPSLPATGGLYRTAYLLVLLGLVALVVAVVVAARGASAERLAPYSDRVAGLLSSAGGLSLIAATILVANGQGPAIAADNSAYRQDNFGVDWTCGSSPISTFAGRCDALHISFVWGPGVGWYLCLIAGLVGLCVGLIAYLPPMRRR